MSWISNECGWAGSYNLNDSVGGIFKFIGELPTNPSTFISNYFIDSDKNILVYPNPSGDKINIICSAVTGNTILSIYNVSGEKVMERQLTD